MSDHFEKLKNLYLSGPFNAYFDPAVKVEEGCSEVAIAIKPDYFHAAGAAHGATYFKVLDDAAFLAANSMIEDVIVLTIAFTTNIVRPVSEGQMIARGKLVNQANRLVLVEATVHDSNDQLVATASGTFMRSKMRLDSLPGYQLSQ